MSARCTGPDDTVDLFLRELIQGDINDKNLVPNALQRYGLLEEVALGSLCSFNQTTFDYLLEAFETFSFGFFKSSILCCASIVDFKLKEAAKKYEISKGPGDKALEECTSDETVKTLKGVREMDPSKSKNLRNLLENADRINKIRDQVLIHPVIAGVPPLADLALESIKITSDALSST